MGTSSSKTDTITVKPGLPEAESWSTLDAFVTSETGRKRRQTVAVNTYSQGEQVHQVKTTMNYPDSKQISSVALDLHLQKSKTYAAHQSDKTQAVKFSEDMKSSQEPPIGQSKMNREGMGKKSAMKHTPNSRYDLGNSENERNAVLKHASTSMDIKPTLKNAAISNRLDLSGDKSKQKILKRYPTSISATSRENQQDDQRNKSESEEPYKRAQFKKKGRSFFDLRKAMVNREKVSLELRKSYIQLPSPQPMNENQAGAHCHSLVYKREREIKVYSNVAKFEAIIDKDLPPGFDIFTEISATEKKSKNIMEGIKVRSNELRCREEIDALMQLWKTNGFLSNIEKKVSEIPPGKATTIVELSHQLTASDAVYLRDISNNPIHIQIAKAYAVYYWTASNITFDSVSWTSYLQGADLPLGRDVLVERKAVCHEYSQFFKQLCLDAKLDAEIIDGEVRTWQELTGGNDRTLSVHSWNVVKIGNISLQIDCMLGSGYFNQSLGYTKAYTNHYFATAPNYFILTHWPENPSHQLLESPVLLHDLQTIIPVPMTTIGLGIQPSSWSEVVYISKESQYPIASIDLDVPDELMISATLIPGSSISCNYFDRYVYIRRYKNKCNIQAVAPLKGQYKLCIYYKEEKTPCLSYIIHCDTDPKVKVGYPQIYELALTDYDFNLIHWNYPTQMCVCQNVCGYLNIVFEAKSGMEFNHCIISGRVADPTSCKQDEIYHYNTILVSNKGTDADLYQLQAVFPSEGWWTVHLSGENHKFRSISLLNYYVYVNVGLPTCSYPYILAPGVIFNNIKPITATGEDLLEVPFISSKYLDFQHYLTLNLETAESVDGYSNIVFEGKVRNENTYIYLLKIIFSRPGNWFVHVLSKDKDSIQEYTHLFKLNIAVKGAKENTRFINYNDSIGRPFNIEILNGGVLTFLDDGQPFTYEFKASSHVNFFHALKFQEKESSDTLDYHTFLSSQHDIKNTIQSSITFTLHAVFPFVGKWSVLVLAAEEYSGNYSLIFSLDLNVKSPTPQLCYPRIHSMFYKNNMILKSEHAVLNSSCKGGEIKVPFRAPEGIYFTWNMEYLPTGKKSLSNAFIHHCPSVDAEGHNCLLHIIFPRPGDWLIRLFLKQISDSMQKTVNFQSVLEVKIQNIFFNSQVSFPQIFEPFYSTFGLSFDEKDLPLISEIQQTPSEMVIRFYSPVMSVKFTHDIDVKSTEKNNIDVDYTNQCRIMSNPLTGLHEVIVQVVTKGEWTISIYARHDTANGSWIIVFKHVIITVE